ncbi:hypothetical protein KIPB_004364, partial [Kipferlia bialata]
VVLEANKKGLPYDNYPVNPTPGQWEQVHAVIREGEESGYHRLSSFEYWLYALATVDLGWLREEDWFVWYSINRWATGRDWDGSKVPPRRAGPRPAPTYCVWLALLADVLDDIFDSPDFRPSGEKSHA